MNIIEKINSEAVRIYKELNVISKKVYLSQDHISELKELFDNKTNVEYRTVEELKKEVVGIPYVYSVVGQLEVIELEDKTNKIIVTV